MNVGNPEKDDTGRNLSGDLTTTIRGKQVKNADMEKVYGSRWKPNTEGILFDPSTIDVVNVGYLSRTKS